MLATASRLAMWREPHQAVKVPSDKRQALVKQRDDVWIESEEHDGWVKMNREQDSYLVDYLGDKYPGASKRFWNVRAGTRVGYNGEGVFLHENHVKRFYGLEKDKISASLAHAMPTEAVPMVNAKGERVQPGSKNDQILGKMLHHLPTLSDDMRYTVLDASFKRADRNGNGKLSRPELSIILRRILNTLRSEDVSEILRDADKNDDGELDYQEFVAWLRKSAHSKISKAFGTSLMNEADIVRATFRMWDKNGDGLIANGFLVHALKKVHPNLSENQVKALVKTMDCDHDGNIDYDEFVDFLFHRAEQNPEQS